MKTLPNNHIIILLALLVLYSCGSGGGEGAEDQSKQQVTMESVDPYQNWDTNHGVGPISELTLPDEIDQEMAANGKEVYDAMCTACHKIEKKFIGPSPQGIMDRRTPAWIMNMILNPEEMVQQDPIAKKLLIEYNGSPMANQNLTQEQARAVLEYFRTL
jgi:mono/diheme cytochrome c family protein